jgi:hypothetical protein
MGGHSLDVKKKNWSASAWVAIRQRFFQIVAPCVSGRSAVGAQIRERVANSLESVNTRYEHPGSPVDRKHPARRNLGISRTDANLDCFLSRRKAVGVVFFDEQQHDGLRWRSDLRAQFSTPSSQCQDKSLRGRIG